MDEDDDEWIPAGLALKVVAARVSAELGLDPRDTWKEATNAVFERLIAGTLHAAPEGYLLDYQGQERPLSYWFSLRQIETDGRAFDHVPFVEPDQNVCCIPTDFWRAYRHSAAESQADWLSGDFYIDHLVDGSGSWSGFARSVHLNRSALPGSELAPRHLNVLAPNKANHSERSTSKGGAPTKYDWPRAIAHVVALAETDGIDPEGRGQETNASRIARLMEHWFDSQGADVPGGSQLRRYAGMIVAAIHQHRAERQLKSK